MTKPFHRPGPLCWSTAAAWAFSLLLPLVPGTVLVTGLAGQLPAVPLRSETGPEHTILFLGDSLTAGYGLPDPANQAFPQLVGKRLATGGHPPTRVVAAGVSGDTSAGGLRRIDWLLRRPVDVLVLELGANDGLRGVAPVETRRNLQAIIDRVRAKNPTARVVVAGMRLPPSMGGDYGRAYEAIFPALAQANQATLIPFLLEGVGGRPELNQPDGIHPTTEGHRIVAETVWRALEPLL